MLRIGEAAKRFNISNRTLRYWEDEGIIKSTRSENGYRFFDEENGIRIRQIILLRNLKMPISEIERIFKANDFDIVLNSLARHLESLKSDAALYDSLIIVIKNLIKQMQGFQRLEQIFSYMEQQEALVNLKSYNIMQLPFSDNNAMTKDVLDNVRIVRLTAMTVASYRAESEAPEKDCAAVLVPFVLTNNLHKRDGYRSFGFNNPNPSANNSVYGYEMWVTIPNDFPVPAPFTRKHFGGGLYASISTNICEIGERWQRLHQWCISNEKYDTDYAIHWLEECSMDFEKFNDEQTDESEKQLDILEPIKPRE